MLANICMKFHEGIFNGFWATERTRPYRKIFYFQFQMAIIRKLRNPELRFLRSARRLMLLYIKFCVMFHENISNVFLVTEQTRFCDRQMDRQTDGRIDDPSKNNISPNPKGGRQKKVVSGDRVSHYWAHNRVCYLNLKKKKKLKDMNKIETT